MTINKQNASFQTNTFDIELNKAKQLLASNHPFRALKILNVLFQYYPDDLDLALFLAVAETKVGHHRKCLSLLDQLLKKNIHDERIYLYRALSFEALQMKKEAIKSYQDLISINPESFQAFNNLGLLLQKINRPKDALECFTRAIKINPNYAPAFSGRAQTLKHLGLYTNSINDYKKSIQLDPKNAQTYNNFAIFLSELGEDDEAIIYFDKSIEISSNFSSAYFNKAEHLLKIGNYLEGWDLYEWRWKTKFRKRGPPSNSPELSLNSSLKNKEILVYAEGGFGDIIMFGRYLFNLIGLNAKVTVMLPEPLINIFKESSNKYQVLDIEQTPPKADFQCSMMSFPKIFKTTLETIPSKIPYFFINHKLQDIWNKKFKKSSRLRIGLVWSGNSKRQIDKNPLRSRSISIDNLNPLLNLPFEFHSLQKEYSEHDLKFLVSNPSIKDHHKELLDFSDTAALINQMDLVISIDTSVAHLAGALGKPLWILLPFAHDYRWVTKNERNAWYPKTVAFKKDRLSTWEDVIFKLITKLKSTYNIN